MHSLSSTSVFVTSRRAASGVALAIAACLAGCATSWVVDSEVNSFSRGGSVAAGAGYRFERLPSQQGAEPGQSQLEAMADVALQRAGLRRDDVKPAYSAQVSARVTVVAAPWGDPFLSPGWGPGYPFGYGPRYRAGFGGGYGAWRGGGWGRWGDPFHGPVFPPNPWYQREVNLVLRALPSGLVVYETSARNDGPSAASGAVLPTLFDAALEGFPNPPAGPRRVRIAIPLAQP